MAINLGAKQFEFDVPPSVTVTLLCLQSSHRTDHRYSRSAGELRRVGAPQCPHQTARLTRSLMGRSESSLSWSCHLFQGRPAGDVTTRSA